MRHFLILLALVACGVNAMAQGSIAFTNDTGNGFGSLSWFHGEIQEPLSAGNNLTVKGELYTLRGDAYSGFVAGDTFLFVDSTGFEVYFNTSVGLPVGVYVVPVSMGDTTFTDLAQFASFAVTPVPEPSTNVFFLMGLTLLILSNGSRSGRWSPFHGALVPQPSLSRSGISGGR